MDSLQVYAGKISKFWPVMLKLAERDLRIKYAQTTLGIIWIILQPILMLAVFTLFFAYLLKLEIGYMPYALYALIGALTWIFFSQLMVNGGNALLDARHLMNRLYFPRLILVFARATVALLEFLFSLLVVQVVLLIAGRVPGWTIVFAPLFIILTLATGLSIAIWLSALTVRYRDLQHVVPFLVAFGIWLTPVFYPATLIPSGYHIFLHINPLAAAMAGLRWTMAGGPVPDAAYWISVIPVFLLLLSGCWYFRKIEDNIADYL